jgi:hypothetical protein
VLYLLDANVLITAHNSYYPIDRVPEFWEWLAHVCSEEHAKVPIELHEEITVGNDALADWARDGDNRRALLLDTSILNTTSDTLSPPRGPEIKCAQELKAVDALNAHRRTNVRDMSIGPNPLWF